MPDASLFDEPTSGEGPIVAFYRGHKNDSEGRSLSEIRAWGDNRLESVHDYIQWMFPNQIPSRFNPDAPLLDDEQIRAFHGDKQLRAELIKSFERMMSFYGFEMTEEDGQPRVSPAKTWNERKRVWLNPGNHNFLRITRILTCLRLLGAVEQAQAFLVALARVYESEAKGVIGARTFQFWQSAVR